jgi:Uma2 family endonuclease
MNIRAKLAPEHQLTIDEFLALTASRPDGERWELIEGVAVLNPSPVDWHQIIVSNIVAHLMNHKAATGAPWFPMIGTGTRVPASANSLPQPDALVKEHGLTGSAVTDDAIVIFEVWSKSNAKSDRDWRRRMYSSVTNCQHYVTLDVKRVEATVYSRSSGWTGETVKAIAGSLDLAAIGVDMPLADIYRWTPLATETGRRARS